PITNPANNEFVPRGIVLDDSGNAYLAGQTQVTALPTTAGVAQPTSGGGGADGFPLELAPGGGSLGWATHLGGSRSGRTERVDGLARDTAGHVYVAGVTNSTNFPTTSGVVQPAAGGNNDGFVAELGPNGSSVYSTYLGTSDNDDLTGVAADGAGHAW